MNGSTHDRILLIDDDPVFGGVLTRTAETRGIRLDYFESLVDALYDSYLEEYDAAIIDCCMPGLNGFEVSQYLATFLKSIPVVLVSQTDGPFRRYMEERSGASAFVPKRQGAGAILDAAWSLTRGLS